MAVECLICHGPVNPHDVSTWKQVTAWVGGPKKDSAKGRKDTGNYAHNHCVQASLVEGIAADQASLQDAENDTQPVDMPADTDPIFGED